MSLFDPSATPKNRRLDPDTFDQLFQVRWSKHSDEEWAERGERLSWFINEILEMSIRALPRAVRLQWKGSAAVDATVIPAFARPSRRARRKKKGVARPRCATRAIPMPTGITGTSGTISRATPIPNSRSGLAKRRWSSAAPTTPTSRRPCPHWSWVWLPFISPAPRSGKTPSGRSKASPSGVTLPITWPVTAPTPSQSPNTSSSRPELSVTAPCSTTRSTSSANRGVTQARSWSMDRGTARQSPLRW